MSELPLFLATRALLLGSAAVEGVTFALWPGLTGATNGRAGDGRREHVEAPAIAVQAIHLGAESPATAGGADGVGREDWSGPGSQTCSD